MCQSFAFFLFGCDFLENFVFSQDESGRALPVFRLHLDVTSPKKSLTWCRMNKLELSFRSVTVSSPGAVHAGGA